jgi:S1-C subfamily serine protease
VAPERDLAVLSVADEKFHQRRPALARTKNLPRIQDSVTVYGFPIGGNDLAVTKGVVSRIDFGSYYQCSAGLIIQVSAAINPGNSGGPAVVGGRMIGVVFSRSNSGENIGFIIPNEEIDTFLEDVGAGRYDGKLLDISGAEFQRLENESLRRFLKLANSVKGVMVIPARHGAANDVFEEFDVLTKIGPYDVDNDGMVQLPNNLRLAFHSVIPKLAKDNRVPVTLLRKGERVQAFLPVSKQDPRLIREFKGEKLSYFIYGPLVFSSVKADPIFEYTRAKPASYVNRSPLLTRRLDFVRFPGEELVMVASSLFAHKITKGYQDPIGQVLTEVNGVQIKNLRHLVETLRDCPDEFVTFRFAELGTEVLVFRRDEMNQATEGILEDNGISPSRRGSEDMLKVWNRAAATSE